MAKKVAILGCGPSGLLAAHAAQINRCDFEIFSKKRPSELYGSQYLHEPISGITGLPEAVSYRLEGTPEGYRRKVYGDDWDGTVSPEDLEWEHWAWDIRSAYDELWRRYQDEVVDLQITGSMIQLNADIGLERFDVVISTLPRKVWAVPGDKFESAKVYAIGDAPERDQEVPFKPAQNNTILCDGTEDVGWYRASRVFDYATIEWPLSAKPPVPGLSVVEKPLRYIGADNPANEITHLGRYGKWEKGVLTTDAFNDALKVTA